MSGKVDTSSDFEDVEDYEEEEWIPYHKRPEWKDVEPVKQSDNDNVVKILYSPKFSDIFDYFRAICKSGEISERALGLTEDAANANPANYTVWYQRRKILQGLKIQDYSEELKFSRDIMEQNPKSYQIWEHRRKLIEWTKDPSKEKRLTEIVLSNDAKNYHAWQHRQWVLSTFDLYEGELEYVDRLLEEDVRNNSAWNQRFFVLQRTQKVIQGQTLQNELNYTFKAIEKVYSNESSWNYLTGLMDQCLETELDQVRKQISDFCYDLFENKGIKNHYLLACIVDVHASNLEDDQVQNTHEHLEKATQLCADLASKYDTIRAEYWRFLERDFKHRFGKSNE